MKCILTITFMIFFQATMAFSPERGQMTGSQVICIVHPEVIQSCVESGGRFDYEVCSCVGGASTT